MILFPCFQGFALRDLNQAQAAAILGRVVYTPSCRERTLNTYGCAGGDSEFRNRFQRLVYEAGGGCQGMPGEPRVGDPVGVIWSWFTAIRCAENTVGHPPHGFRTAILMDRQRQWDSLPRKQVAADFGVGFSTLSRWIQQDRCNPEKPTAQSDLEREVAELRKENCMLREEEVIK